MTDPYISFYLKTNCIHVYMSTLRKLGNPKRICLMIGENGKSLLVAPYKRKDFKSHGVPASVYTGSYLLHIYSIRLCNLLAASHSWNSNCSYRVHGRYIAEYNVTEFHLTDAEIIGYN